ncbi:MAG: IS630 family transposase [Acidimicrobiia bacterium]
MDGIVPNFRFAAKQRIQRELGRFVRQRKDARLSRRGLIILNLLQGQPVSEVARTLDVNRTTVYRVAERFRDLGVAGLLDRREDNGELKIDDDYLGQLYEVVRATPESFEYTRPTWTRELLVMVMARKTGIVVSLSTMSRALKKIGARRGRPRPVVRCPWSKQAKAKRLRMIDRLLQSLGPREVAVYADEVDIHLNPKIGNDWMVPGQQKEVVTPGKNEKRYLAGAMDATTKRLTWFEGEKKNSMLFIGLLHELRRAYPNAKVIHVIVDNFGIHSSKITQAVVAGLNGRVVLHFLPPYCPNENRIERLWQDLHAQVTRNHTCPTMAKLMPRVRAFLRRRANPAPAATRRSTRRVA